MALNKISERRKLEYRSELLQFAHEHLRTRFFTLIVLSVTLLLFYFQGPDIAESIIGRWIFLGSTIFSVLISLTIYQMIMVQKDINETYKKLMK